ncbi:MAG: hypothetical protein ACM3MH_07145 [Actinomycetota bacterium]
MKTAVSLMSGAMLLAGLTHASAASLAGKYQAAGTNLDGSPYTGTAEITATSDTTCTISWQTTANSKGICMRNGNSFAASYALGGSIGLVVYQIKPDGTLEGLWTVAGQNGVGTEVLTPAK